MTLVCDYFLHEADNDSLPEIASSQFITGFIAMLDALRLKLVFRKPQRIIFPVQIILWGMQSLYVLFLHGYISSKLNQQKHSYKF